jgi:hypothetical protein
MCRKQFQGSNGAAGDFAGPGTMSLAPPVSQAAGDGAKCHFLANLEKMDIMENDKGV